MNDKLKKKAAALKYDAQSQNAPYLVALGQGHIADKMIDKAVEAGVEVVEDTDLANMLSSMSIGDEIPAELYEVVAKIMVFINKIDEEYGVK